MLGLYNRLLLPSLLLTVGAALTAQGSQGVHALGRFDPIDDYVDVWGYAAPNGDEYALVGTTTGTWVIDCSNPRDPQSRGFIAGPPSGWRDIRTFGSYAYIVTEGGGGFQVVDLSNPNAPNLIGTVGASRFGNAHNICVDLGTGRVYCVGTNAGTVIFDAAANPAAPVFAGTYNGPYLHDLHVQNGMGFGSALGSGLLLLDVTSLPLTQLSATQTPNDFTHNAWTDATISICVTTDERNGSVAQFYDVSNPAAPVALGSYTPNSASSPHNAFIVGDRCHISWYTQGYRLLDISNPQNPVEIGFYDTCTNISSGGFSGAWGCYPFQPSGIIYVSDRSTGLWVLQPNDLDIAHTPLENTENTATPYAVRAVVSSSTAVAGVTLEWSTDNVAFNAVPMAAVGGGYEASIPAQAAGTEVFYRIVGENGDGLCQLPELASYRFAVGVPERPYFDDFETETGWTSVQVATQNDWHRAKPNAAAGAGWSEPGDAFSGRFCRGNDLGHCTFGGSYASNVSNYLESPAIPTRGVQGLELRFQRWLTVAAGDVASVSVNGTTVYTNGTAAVVDSSWTQQAIDISSITDGASSATIRFSLMSDGSSNFGGWTIDDVELRAADSCFTQLYGSGTAGSAGVEPTISAGTAPRIGTAFRVDGAGMVGAAPVALFLSPFAGSLSIFGIEILVDLNLTSTFPSLATGPAGVPGVGTASHTFVLPNDPVIVGADLRVQWICGDAGGPGGLVSASRGLRFRVCQ